MDSLIFGKDQTLNVVGVEPGYKDQCTLFIQGADGNIQTKSVPMTHWILFSQQHSPKMKPLEGNQHYKYIMEYDNYSKYEEVLKSSYEKRLDLMVSRDRKEAFMMKHGVTYFKGMKVKDVSVLSFDLEHTYGIGEKLNKSGKLLLISNTYRNSDGKVIKRLFSFDEYHTEAEMLSDWLDFVCTFDPTILVGHNIFGHDFKILKYASSKNGIPLRLGRNNSELVFDYRKSLKRKDGSQAYDYHNVHCYGREIIDTFFLAINYDVARNYESYGLKAIIKHEKLEKPGRVHYDASKILQNYTVPEEWVRIKEYAKDDADDALALYDLMIPSLFYSANSIPRSLQYINNSASGSQINGMMVRAYLQDGHSIAKASEAVEFEGAISFGIPGIHKNVLRLDVSSLYPSTIRQYKIYNKQKDPKAYFLQMVNYFTEERLKNKRIAKETEDRYFEDLQGSQKIMINSMYGFLGAGRVNYNYPIGAAEVTKHGRRILKQAIMFITGKEYQSETVLEIEESA